MKASVVILLASVVASSACVTEITDVATFKAQKSNMNLIIDVRNWDEYTGSGDANCNSGNDKNKCNYGHHTSMSLLENTFRTDKAAVYKKDGKNTVEISLINALKACYGSQATTTKVMTSCHSGSRSGLFQDKLVEAGFTCANIYNFKPGAKGLHEAWVASNKTDTTLEMKKGAGSPGVFKFSTCPFDKSGLTNKSSDETSTAMGAASWKLGLMAAFLMGLFM